jgi:hypothetical protein
MSGMKSHKFSFLAVYLKNNFLAAQNTLYYLRTSRYRNISLYGYHLITVIALLDTCNHSFGPFPQEHLPQWFIQNKVLEKDAIVPTPPSTPTLRELPSKELR